MLLKLKIISKRPPCDRTHIRHRSWVMMMKKKVFLAFWNVRQVSCPAFFLFHRLPQINNKYFGFNSNKYNLYDFPMWMCWRCLDSAEEWEIDCEHEKYMEEEAYEKKVFIRKTLVIRRVPIMFDLTRRSSALKNAGMERWFKMAFHLLNTHYDFSSAGFLLIR